jgi:hypothetical protein
MLQIAAVAGQVVVCRAPSGHVEIESAFDGDCCPVATVSYAVQAIGADDACDGCVDTPLVRVGLSAPAKGVLPGVVPAPWRLVLPPGQQRPVCAAASVAPPASGARRSVVLLI